MEKPVKRSFVVYYSKEFVFLRIVLLLAPVLCSCEAIYMRQHWLHFFTGILLIVQINMFSFISKRLVLDVECIHVKRLFQKELLLRWSEISHTGDFSMVHLGSHTTSQVYFFSKKPVYPYEFIRSHTLPRITEDFVFILNQPEIKDSVLYYKESGQGEGSKTEDGSLSW